MMIRWLATIILLWFIYQVRHVFPPIIVGGIIAYLVLPLVQWIALKTRLSRGIATAIVYMGLLSCLIGLGMFLGPHIGKELKDLSDPSSQREIVAGAIRQFAASVHWQGDVEQATEQVLKAIGETFQKPEEIMHLGTMFSHGALALLVCTVSSIYFTLDAPVVGRFFLRYVPQDRQAQIVEIASQMNVMLSKYVRGQIVLIVIMSIVAYVILTIFHVKYAPLIAVFSGVLEVIPVLGPIIATTTATVIAISQHGGMVGVYVAVCYILARWIEDYVVVPKVIGHAVELHPLAVIFAVLCGETLAGGLGMLIAIPVAASIKLVLDFFTHGQLTQDPVKKGRRSTGADQTKTPAAGGNGEGAGQVAIELDSASAAIKRDMEADWEVNLKKQEAKEEI